MSDNTPTSTSDGKRPDDVDENENNDDDENENVNENVNENDVFQYLLPPERLGKRHVSFESFVKEAYGQSLPSHQCQWKRYTLVLVTQQSKRRLLLGLKHRGFGTGFYNGFGGKLEAGETAAEGAVRELEEETGLIVTGATMEQGYLGELWFTFDNDDDDKDSDNKGMRVSLFRIELDEVAVPVDASTLRGCDEITPSWLEDWREAPFDTHMHADDSIWYPLVLRVTPSAIASFTLRAHFAAGGTAVNTIRHHYYRVDYTDTNTTTDRTIEETTPRRYVVTKAPRDSLEQRLFHALHSSSSSDEKERMKLSIKEFKESWAFANAVRTFYGTQALDDVIDVAGGHGALAALLLLLTSARRAVVVDPSTATQKGTSASASATASASSDSPIARAWSEFLPADKSLVYRHECLRTGLPEELRQLSYRSNQTTLLTDNASDTHTDSTSSDTHNTDNASDTPLLLLHRVLVVACHACQHLTDETIQIATGTGTVTVTVGDNHSHKVSVSNLAFMACCHKDHTHRWKRLAKDLGLHHVGVVMDLLKAGQLMNAGYEVKMKLLDPQISPVHNRLVLCRRRRPSTHPENSHPTHAPTPSPSLSPTIQTAHEKLTKAYHRAHRPQAQHTHTHTHTYAYTHNPIPKSVHHHSPFVFSFHSWLVVVVGTTCGVVGIVVGMALTSIV